MTDQATFTEAYFENLYDQMTDEEKILMAHVFMSEPYANYLTQAIREVHLEILNLDAESDKFALQYSTLQKKIGIYEDLKRFLDKGKSYCFGLNLDALKTELPTVQQLTEETVDAHP